MELKKSERVKITDSVHSIQSARASLADIAANAIRRSPILRASGPDTAEICGPMVRSGRAGLKAAIRPTVR